MNQESKPLVSVVMPNWNAKQYLSAAIESILSQTYTNLEFIMVDDGSTDGSFEVMEDFAKRDPRVKHFQNEVNQKICNTLNIGVSHAKGKYIVRMDSDDISLPNRIEKQVAFMEDPANAKVGVCGSFVEVIDQDNKTLFKKTHPISNAEIKKAFWFLNPLQHSTTIIRKECFDEFGGYDPDFVNAEDLELWLRFGQKWEFANIPEVLVKYRIYGNNAILARQKDMIRRVLRGRKKAVKEYGYHMPFMGHVSYVVTKTALLLPPRMVLGLFNFFRKKYDK